MLPEKVRRTIERYEMIRPGGRAVVAVSGGPDSVALLRALYELREDLHLELIVAHLDHRMRPDSWDDARFVAELAASLKLPLASGEVDVPALCRREKLSPEEGARRARYRFLREVAQAHHARAVALGHTLNDRVETFFLNLLRGAGLEGLAGMPPVRRDPECDLRYIRPLVECTRAEVLAYLEELRQDYREDPTNRDRRYLRNRVRLDLLPLWERLRPRAPEAVVRASEIAARAHEHLERHAKEIFPQIAEGAGKGEEVVLRRAKLLAQDAILREYLLREALRRLGDEEKEPHEHGLRGLAVGAEHLERLLREIERPRSGQQVTLPQGVRVLVEPERVVLTRRPPRPRESYSYSYCHKLRMGENDLEEIGWRFRLELKEGSHPPPPGGDPLEARIDWDTIAGPLRVRNRRPGDRLRPLGLGGTKKVQDLLVDAKVPREVRDRVPLVGDEKGILWVVGLALDERVRVTPRTKRTLLLRATPFNEEEFEFLTRKARKRKGER